MAAHSAHTYAAKRAAVGEAVGKSAAGAAGADEAAARSRADAAALADDPAWGGLIAAVPGPLGEERQRRRDSAAGLLGYGLHAKDRQALQAESAAQEAYLEQVDAAVDALKAMGLVRSAALLLCMQGCACCDSNASYRSSCVLLARRARLRLFLLLVWLPAPLPTPSNPAWHLCTCIALGMALLGIPATYSSTHAPTHPLTHPRIHPPNRQWGRSCTSRPPRLTPCSSAQTRPASRSKASQGVQRGWWAPHHANTSGAAPMAPRGRRIRMQRRRQLRGRQWRRHPQRSSMAAGCDECAAGGVLLAMIWSGHTLPSFASLPAFAQGHPPLPVRRVAMTLSSALSPQERYHTSSHRRRAVRKKTGKGAAPLPLLVRCAQPAGWLQFSLASICATAN